MIRELSNAQKEYYNNNSPPLCPWCQSKALKAGKLLPHSDKVFRCPVTCTVCKETWYELYQRQGIEDCIRLQIYKGKE